MSTAYDLGFSRGTNAAQTHPDAKELGTDGDLWIDLAIESAVDAGYTGPDDGSCDEYVSGFIAGAVAQMRAC